MWLANAGLATPKMADNGPSGAPYNFRIGWRSTNGPALRPNRGLMSVNLEQWISDHKIDEVECIVPDINGVQRGKVLPAQKFLSSVRDKSLRIPGSVFICTIDGDYPEDIADIWDKDPDKTLIADLDTICIAPGFKSPTAFVIADAPV